MAILIPSIKTPKNVDIVKIHKAVDSTEKFKKKNS